MASKKPAAPKHIASSTTGNIVPWLGLATIILLLDQLTKITISHWLSLGQSYSVTSFFNLVLAQNHGAAFSFLARENGWQRYFFTGLGIVAAVYIIYLLRRHAGQTLFCTALALILGGAIGNVLDRMLYGYVIDFLDVFWGNAHWPAFNVADSAICVGAALFIVDELRRVNR